MPYEPCGSPKLSGEILLIRLAQELGATPAELRDALLRLLSKEISK
jgi:hypothetical protein